MINEDGRRRFPIFFCVLVLSMVTDCETQHAVAKNEMPTSWGGMGNFG